MCQRRLVNRRAVFRAGFGRIVCCVACLILLIKRHEIDRVEHDGRIAAIAGRIGQYAARKREKLARRFNQQNRLGVTIGNIDEAKHAAIFKLGNELHIVSLFRFNTKFQPNLIIRIG